jgi:hypothetical protein
VFDPIAGKSRVRSTVSLLEKVKKNESEGLWVEEIMVELELIVNSYEPPRA